MKIIGWTDWHFYGFSEEHDANYEYKEMEPKTIAEMKEIETIIAQELCNKGYKFDGNYHQNGDFGVPIFDTGEVYQCTFRGWGRIMAQAYPDEIDNSDGMGYCDWAWIAPVPMVVPNNDDYKEGESNE